jgi:TonB-dependent SusC/RagA subfamily outer membrane receptor
MLLAALIPFSGGLAGQERTLQGRILTTETGVPWAGAAIGIQETGRMVCADSQGRFELTLPMEGETRLWVRPVGFPPTELTVVAADDEMLVPLAAHVAHLEGVVVTVYAQSVPAGSPYGSTVLESGELNRVPGELSSSLAGKAPGAVVSQNSGAPGGGFQVALRGVRTLLGNADVLVVVDGVPTTSVAVGSGTSVVTGSRPEEEDRGNRLADFNTLDIARVEILQGVAAAQRYGSRAANGVIVITTRTGHVIEPESESDPSLACYLPTGRP